MNMMLRCIVTFIVLIALVGISNLVQGILIDNAPSPIGSAFSWLLALVVARFVWKKTASREAHNGLFTSIGLGACILGGIGLFGGFVGPMIFAPESNQGPLLGILITGPAGFVLGALGGAVRWFFRKKHF